MGDPDLSTKPCFTAGIESGAEKVRTGEGPPVGRIPHGNPPGLWPAGGVRLAASLPHISTEHALGGTVRCWAVPRRGRDWLEGNVSEAARAVGSGAGGLG